MVLKISYQQNPRVFFTIRLGARFCLRDNLKLFLKALKVKSRGLHVMSQKKERECNPNTHPPPPSLLSSIQRPCRKIKFDTSYLHPPAAIKIKIKIKNVLIFHITLI